MADHAELCKALRSYQQADMDGVMVLVSRQACDEAAAEIERLRGALRGISEMKAEDLYYAGDYDNAAAAFAADALKAGNEQESQRERAMQELADQAQELKMGYDEQVIPGGPCVFCDIGLKPDDDGVHRANGHKIPCANEQIAEEK